MTTRREFLAAEPLRRLASRGEEPPAAASIALPGHTLRLGLPAMASDFEVILNPHSQGQMAGASEALDLIARLEDQLSVYRPASELSRINAQAHLGPVRVERRLWELLEQTLRYARETDGAFDPTAGPLVSLWRRCRAERRIPTAGELDAARKRLGANEVTLDHQQQTIQFHRPGIELNLNAIGKGYALDRAAELLLNRTDSTDRPEAATNTGEVAAVPVKNPSDETPVPSGDSCADDSWLMHGGYSSLLARGGLGGGEGWPIALRHPLFPGRELATIRLKNQALSTSGSAVQFFRVGGKRYGHLLDPRTGWPVEGMLSVSVLAPTAAEAEALSTAFFVLGVEKAQSYCHNYPEVAALLVPAPVRGGRLEPVTCGIPPGDLEWNAEL
ncbi:MAG: FAD:protein FMN transferase [Planctomycetales bacterium]